MRVDPKIDFAFKCLFGSESRKHLLIALLRAVLRIEIADVTILNPYNVKETPKAKTIVLDIKARLLDGALINVEMQMSSVKAYGERSLYYWASLYSAQLKQGEEYTGISRTVAIHIINNVLFENIAEYHLEFEIRSVQHPELRLTDRFSLHTIELPKLQLEPAQLSSELDAWCYFFNHAEEMEEAILQPMPAGKVIGQALEELKAMFQTDPERELYEASVKQARDKLWIERASRKEGLEAGQAIGQSLGMQSALNRVLEDRFGKLADSLSNRIGSITDIDRLGQLVSGAVKATTLEEFEKLL